MSTTRRPIPESWYEGCPEITPSMRAEVAALLDYQDEVQQAAHQMFLERALKSNIPLARLAAEEEKRNTYAKH